ncbi:FAD-dependent oxidoreductase [Leucobacter sp. M11]|uniref:FAD-dependent oxidoreductase n=1 Tax=Leucobacter sp. M11 TaxID=2993565 RepID=UPI002D7F6373|nr:FAD-dependent oxidoreductase [Leucobacter sp. M11]MEB4614743.1 FAD-dependent oxidoreductase [Leucobacter sp. M11]
MSSPSTPRIAIVGSGPSGCYLAQSLRRALPEAIITVFDQLACPFGLIRYGVAADHQSTKAITRQFERLFTRDGVTFAGNIRLGRDLGLDELQEHYDLVALATGLSQDRGLTVPGEHLPGVHSAGVLTRLLNAHPDSTGPFPELGPAPVILGAGNVAIDLVRFLAKRPEHFAGSDIHDDALADYAARPAERITVVSRSPVATAKGDPLMLRELGKLEHVRFTSPDDLSVPADADRAAIARAEALATLTDPARAHSSAVEVVLRFGWAPGEILADPTTGRAATVALTNAAGDREPLAASAVIRAVGFELGSGLAGLVPAELLEHRSDSGFVRDGLYRTGWVKRGPTGTIPENRSDAKQVADEIQADLASGRIVLDPRKRGFAGLPAAVQERAVSFADWQRLDLAEIAEAGPDRVRRKRADHDHMLRLARSGHLADAPAR